MVIEWGVITEKYEILGGGAGPFLCFGKLGLFCDNLPAPTP